MVGNGCERLDGILRYHGLAHHWLYLLMTWALIPACPVAVVVWVLGGDLTVIFLYSLPQNRFCWMDLNIMLAAAFMWPVSWSIWIFGSIFSHYYSKQQIREWREKERRWRGQDEQDVSRPLQETAV